MAAAPEEEPELYVCVDCHTVLAGTPTDPNPNTRNYEPPESCPVCDGDEIVEIDRYPEYV